ncbi:MAG: ABC transporter substrate-binding protein [Methylobacteriaceae bacterium]|nr:ABC transporter substrate-binding protein [Methylobacteriaceae bacterium]
MSSLSRRTILAGGAAALAASSRPARATAALDKVVYQASWLPQAEQGGFHQAVATGIYREHGLEVEVRKGGPQVDVNALFLASRVDFVEAPGFTVLNYVAERLPGIAVAAVFQKDPRILVSHRGVGNDTLEDLKGKPILVATAGRQTYWQWLKARYGYGDDQIRPYTFNMAPFLADTRVSMQGLITSEPLDLKRSGVDAVIHFLADQGFGNYQSTIVAAPKTVSEKPDLVQRFVDATIKGWASYLSGDPGPGNALIKAANPDMPDEKIAYAIATMKERGLVDGGDARTLGIGCMTEARWAGFYADMVKAGAQPAGLDVAAGYTTRFVNKKVG